MLQPARALLSLSKSKPILWIFMRDLTSRRVAQRYIYSDPINEKIHDLTVQAKELW